MASPTGRQEVKSAFVVDCEEVHLQSQHCLIFVRAENVLLWWGVKTVSHGAWFKSMATTIFQLLCEEGGLDIDVASMILLFLTWKFFTVLDR